VQRSNRRVLYHPDYVQGFRDALAEARADLREMAERHAARVTVLEAKVAALRAEVDQLRSIALARQRGELELAELRRLQAIGRARLAQYDPATTVIPENSIRVGLAI
jgi:hypothetical protein